MKFSRENTRNELLALVYIACVCVCMYVCYSVSVVLHKLVCVYELGLPILMESAEGVTRATWNEMSLKVKENLHQLYRI